jgi:hypothetical protein
MENPSRYPNRTSRHAPRVRTAQCFTQYHQPQLPCTFIPSPHCPSQAYDKRLHTSSGMFFLPYSPRWLASKNRLEESKSTLLRLHGGSRNANVAVVEDEFSEMLAQIEWGESILRSFPPRDSFILSSATDTYHQSEKTWPTVTESW